MCAVDGVEPGGGPERKRDSITPEGVADVDRWLDTPEAYLKSTLFAKVVLALLTGRPAAGLLDAQRAAGRLRGEVAPAGGAGRMDDRLADGRGDRRRVQT